MNPLLLNTLNTYSELQSDKAHQQYLFTNVSWSFYETLLSDLSDNFPGLRVQYLEGTLELTMPSRQHETLKDNIGRLLGVYLEENRIRFYGLGSTTFKDEARQRGAEPDISFCVNTNKTLPDIAIEVVITSGGIDKLKIYQGLPVAEVWFWQENRFWIYHYQQEQGYRLREYSQFLPDLDLNLLATYVNSAEPLDAVLGYRQALQECSES
jgi:Uma2 family endonuclease